MPTTLTSKKIARLDAICEQVVSVKGVRFIGVVNKMGRKVAGRFRKGVKPLINEKKMQLRYMNLCLDLSLREDFESSLGKVESIIAKRKKANTVCIPISDYFVLVSLAKNVDTTQTVENIIRTFKETLSIKI